VAKTIIVYGNYTYIHIYIYIYKIHSLSH
jgi:hypothetical protein